jgi:hypothetical protein
MAEYFKKLYAQDPLFRALVHSRLSGTQEAALSGNLPDGILTEEDEMEILREYAITLYKEHKTLKSLFMESLKVSGRSIGLNERPDLPEKS